MKHIIKVEVLENLPTIRPLIAMDKNKKFFQEGKSKKPVVPNNEIWYTSTDGKIVNIDSAGSDSSRPSWPEHTNTYEGGKGIIKFTEELTEIPNIGFANI